VFLRDWFMFPGGRNLEQFLRVEIASEQWKANQSAPDHGQERNGELVQKAIDMAYTYGRKTFMAANPQFTALKAQEQKERIQNGRPQSFLDSIPSATTQ
jgi:hypothetical protein